MAVLTTRNKVIALDYDEKHKAVPKELMVDYETGNIYIVAKDGEKIFDITNQIKEQIDNIKGANINIEIEGVGTFNLQELLNLFQKTLDDSVQVVEMGEDVAYVGKETVTDNVSLQVENHEIKIHGFQEAEELTIPQKRNGKLEWVPIVDSGDKEGVITPPSGNDPGTVLPPADPDDGESLKVIIIEPSNDKLYLRSSRRQMTINLDRNCKVVIPRTVDQVSEIIWNVKTNSLAPLLAFPINVLWSNTNNQLQPNSQQIFRFRTWDNGETWCADVSVYNNTNNLVNMDYLLENYYDKDYIDTNYATDKVIKDEHYMKNDIDKKLSWKKER